MDLEDLDKADEEYQTATINEQSFTAEEAIILAEQFIDAGNRTFIEPMMELLSSYAKALGGALTATEELVEKVIESKEDVIADICLTCKSYEECSREEEKAKACEEQ